MWQQIIAIGLVGGCGAWLGLQAFRYLRPKAGAGKCAGGCCEGEPEKTQAGATGGRLIMISSDDMRARLAARKK